MFLKTGYVSFMTIYLLEFKVLLCFLGGSVVQVTSAPAIEHYPQRADEELEKLVADFLRPQGSQHVPPQESQGDVFGMDILSHDFFW